MNLSRFSRGMGCDGGSVFTQSLQKYSKQGIKEFFERFLDVPLSGSPSGVAIYLQSVLRVGGLYRYKDSAAPKGAFTLGC